MDGFQLIQKLCQNHPEVLDVPVPGGNINNEKFVRDIFSDDLLSNLQVRSKIVESRQEVKRYLDQIQLLREALRERILLIVKADSLK